MLRLPASAFLLLASLASFAQTAQSEAPVEKASPAVVIAFVVLFLGSCAAFGIYAVWRAKKDKQAGQEQA